MKLPATGTSCVKTKTKGILSKFKNSVYEVNKSNSFIAIIQYRFFVYLAIPNILESRDGKPSYTTALNFIPDLPNC